MPAASEKPINPQIGARPIRPAPVASRSGRPRESFESLRYPAMPQITIARATTSTTSCEAVSFTLFVRIAKP